MAAALEQRGASGSWGMAALRNRLIASRRFQRWAASFPLARPLMRREGARLFDLMAGFAYSQTLYACVELDLLDLARERPISPAELAIRFGLPPERVAALCQGASALSLLSRRRDGTYSLGRVGAEVLSVPGITELIRHHGRFYRDLRDPVALLGGTAETELAAYWPYTGRGEVGPADAEAYSELMATTQALVAEEVLRSIRLGGATHLMDVGGGSGAFLAAVARAYPRLQLSLFELPPVAEVAAARLARDGLGGRVRLVPGDFRRDELGQGADTISLVRVLFDHGDARVSDILARVFDALPGGGRIIVAEPMSGGEQPCRFGDVYFALYTMAMGTGQVRSPERIGGMLRASGFDDVRLARGGRPYVTRVLTARKPH